MTSVKLPPAVRNSEQSFDRSSYINRQTPACRSYKNTGSDLATNVSISQEFLPRTFQEEKQDLIALRGLSQDDEGELSQENQAK